jgi:hypothetical protein
MTPYYSEQLENGNKFQDTVAILFAKELYIALTYLTSKENQIKIGETLQGIEIKKDEMWSSTGNLYIEIAEKSDPTNTYYVPSGIFRDDNTWLWVIGNEKKIFMLSKKQLQAIYKSHKYKEVITPTSKGFLLPIKTAGAYILKEINLTKPI